MNEPFPTERVFDLSDGVPSLGDIQRGVLLWRTDRSETDPADADGISRVQSGWLAHQSVHDGDDLVSTALTAVTDGPIAGAALHGGGDARPAWLALRFALHLADHRRQHDLHPAVPCIAARERPDLHAHPPRPLVRLPHLLTVRTGDGNLVDAVVWEVMTADQAHRWLGHDLPDQAVFENLLPALLHLRYEARAGRYPPAPSGRQLNDLLSGRYLSIRLVYRHPDLFRALLHRDHPPSAEGDQ